MAVFLSPLDMCQNGETTKMRVFLWVPFTPLPKGIPKQHAQVKQQQTYIYIYVYAVLCLLNSRQACQKVVCVCFFCFFLFFLWGGGGLAYKYMFQSPGHQPPRTPPPKTNTPPGAPHRIPHTLAPLHPTRTTTQPATNLKPNPQPILHP